jgi:aspartate carbamoyltransferase catalytic subunit
MGLTYSLFSKKPGLIVLHPGPVNYGIELDYNVSAYPNVLIQTQVKHGLLSEWIAVTFN